MLDKQNTILIVSILAILIVMLVLRHMYTRYYNENLCIEDCENNYLNGIQNPFNEKDQVVEPNNPFYLKNMSEPGKLNNDYESQRTNYMKKVNVVYSKDCANDCINSSLLPHGSLFIAP